MCLVDYAAGVALAANLLNIENGLVSSSSTLTSSASQQSLLPGRSTSQNNQRSSKKTLTAFTAIVKCMQRQRQDTYCLLLPLDHHSRIYRHFAHRVCQNLLAARPLSHPVLSRYQVPPSTSAMLLGPNGNCILVAISRALW
jgi:hypothetical protein